MSEDNKFESKDALEEWLKSRGVDEDDVGDAAEKLFAKGFNKPSRLLGITVDELERDANIRNPIARELSNKLKDQQPIVYPEDFKQLTEFARQEMKAKTVNQHMSDASLGFAKDLLVGRNISVLVDEANTEVGLGKDPTPYCWTFLALDLVVKKKGEHDGTPGARDWFYEHFLLGTKYNLKVVTGTSLPKIEGDQKSATGKADIQIGFQEQMELETSPFDQAHGLIELKTNVYPLKPGQNILELASLSTISRFGKGVALLATDCNEKWELCYFQDSKTIKRRAYRHGRKCVEDFKELLDSADGRPQEPPPSRRRKQNLPSMDEEGDGGQNLDGFDDGDGKTKALENHVMLNALANQLADIYGERPVVPEWARAENTCPDYYV